MDSQGKENDDRLTQYRLVKVEEGLTETRREIVKLHTEHEQRLRIIEDFVTRESAGGISLKTLGIIIGAVTTITSGIVAAILKLAGVL